MTLTAPADETQKQPHQLSVSIVVPAYNHASYLERAIESILTQSYTVELIVIDDGSTDDTAAILARYGNRFAWESRPNSGQAATLNYGWSKAKGDVIGYLSADDVIKPGAVAEMANVFLSRPDAMVVYCDFELLDPKDNPVRYVSAANFSLERMLTRFECPPGPGALFRRSGFVATGGWDPALRRVPDYEFWLRLALLGEFIRIPKSLAMWRVHEGSQSFSATPPERADEPLRVMDKYFSQPDLPERVTACASGAKAYARLISAQLHARSGRFGIAGHRFIAACWRQPFLLFELTTWRIVANALVQQRFHRVLWWFRYKVHSKRG